MVGQASLLKPNSKARMARALASPAGTFVGGLGGPFIALTVALELINTTVQVLC